MHSCTFKFTYKTGGHFPNDHAAMKAGMSYDFQYRCPYAFFSAGHELRAAARIADCGNAQEEEINLPLMTLVDYQGISLHFLLSCPFIQATNF